MTQARYHARIAATSEDLEAVQALRYQAFIADGGDTGHLDGRDRDAFDDRCTHILVECAVDDRVVATFRLLPLGSGAEIGKSYSAQFYELHGLREFARPMVEMGRFCVAPGETDPDILRTAWGALAAYVDREGVEMLFGCSSFHGTDAQAYADAFAMLRDQHLAPKRWLPRIKAPKVFRFAQRSRRKPDRKTALKTMPPLLRSYLSLGGWVSDHAVVDPDLNTLHVFTGLEIRTIPPGRARVLRAVAL
ncbi:GNAT family N-acetyltransferase [Rhodobacteraceae bacterium]|nr:GNAT family N-acetyltransferase [Paracoccaceae bacterium]